MANWITEDSDTCRELKEQDSDVLDSARPRDGTGAMLEKLVKKFPSATINTKQADRVWELADLLYLSHARLHEALAIFLSLYRQKLGGQESGGGRAHKGMPLLWISEAYRLLGFPVHATRYLMLALCEDAITGEGYVSPDDTGSYFRLVWYHGLSHAEYARYVSKFWELSKDRVALYPEALL